jgi:DNA-binding MarR family transcriptional regulator
MTDPGQHEDLELILAQIIQSFMHFMHETGHTRPMLHALFHIYHAGECPISEIGALSASSPAAASQLVDRLVQQGLVQRSEDLQDRRIKKLRLTEKSLELIHQGITSNRYLVDLMAALTAEQRQIVHTAFGYLAEASRKTHSSHEREAKPNAQNAQRTKT